jgi:hypothetical protein
MTVSKHPEPSTQRHNVIYWMNEYLRPKHMHQQSSDKGDSGMFWQKISQQFNLLYYNNLLSLHAKVSTANVVLTLQSCKWVCTVAFWFYVYYFKFNVNNYLNHNLVQSDRMFKNRLLVQDVFYLFYYRSLTGQIKVLNMF